MSKQYILNDPADESPSKPKAPKEAQAEKVSPTVKDVDATDAMAVSLIRDYEEKTYEKHRNEQVAIFESWKHIETLLADEANNAWSLGDEFYKLAVLKLTIREIADRVVRGKSYVDALASTSQLFPPTKRDKNFTWFNHDLLRRAVNAVDNRMPDDAPALQLKGHLAACLAAIKNAKARTTKDAVTPLVEVLVKEKVIDEEVAKVVSSPDAKAPEIQLFIGRGKGIEVGKPLHILEVRTKPVKGEDLRVGFNLSKLAWRKATMAEENVEDGKRLLVIPIVKGSPQIDEATVTLVLHAVKGDAKSITDLATLFAQDLT